jgi:hypothetical protein
MVGTPVNRLSCRHVRAGRRVRHAFIYRCGKEARADGRMSRRHQMPEPSARARHRSLHHSYGHLGRGMRTRQPLAAFRCRHSRSHSSSDSSVWSKPESCAAPRTIYSSRPASGSARSGCSSAICGSTAAGNCSAGRSESGYAGFLFSTALILKFFVGPMIAAAIVLNVSTGKTLLPLFPTTFGKS